MRKYSIFLSILLFASISFGQTNWRMNTMSGAWLDITNEEHRPNDAFSLVDSSAIKFRLADDGTWSIIVLDEVGNIHAILDSVGYLGLNGITAPTDPLHIKADAGHDNIHLEENSGTEDWQIGVDADGSMTFQDEGTTRVFFEDGGGVGVNMTAAPDKAIEINSATGANLRLTFNDANGSATYYTDLETTSTGGLSIDAVDETIDFNGNYAVDLQNIPDLAAGAGKTGYWLTTDDYIEVTDDADIDFGTADFSIFIGGLRLNSVTGTQYLINKEAGGVGYGLYITTDDLYIRFDDSNVDVSAVIASNVFAVDTEYDITVTFDRDGNATAYINGDSKGTVAVSTASLTLSNAGNLRIGCTTAGASFLSGSLQVVLVWSNVLTYAEVKSLNAPIPYKYLGASQTAKYTSDFSADANGWTASGGTVAGNIEPIGGESDNLRFTTDAANSTHYINHSALLTVGKQYRVTFYYYIPSGQSNIDGIKVTTFAGTSILTETDAWTINSLEGLGYYTNINISAYDGAVSTFQDAGGDDVFYIRGMTVTQIGCVAQYEPDGITPLTWYAASGNSLDGTVSGAIVTNPLSSLMVDGTIILKEQAEADADNTAYGQLWVDTATPNVLYFTDDAGTDWQISGLTPANTFVWHIGPADWGHYQATEPYPNTPVGYVYPETTNGFMVAGLDIPYQMYGGTVVLDQITIYYSTNEAGDDFDFALIRTDQDGSVTIDEDQDDIGNGGTGYASITCLAGDITLADFAYWVEIDANNCDAPSDINISDIKFDGHIE